MVEFWSGVGASVVAALIFSGFLWARVWLAAGKYCSRWDAYNLKDRKLILMQVNSVTRISRVFTCCPCTWLQPGTLLYHGEYDGTVNEGRVKLEGEIVINPVAVNQAMMTMRRKKSGEEYVVQEYFRMGNGDIYVVPQGSDKDNPDYQKHVLRKKPT